jgi:hypothetical protein
MIIENIHLVWIVQKKIIQIIINILYLFLFLFLLLLLTKISSSNLLDIEDYITKFNSLIIIINNYTSLYKYIHFSKIYL